MSSTVAVLRMRGLAVSIFTSALGLASAAATPLPVLDVAAMTNRSQVIVVGRVEDVRVQGVAPSASIAIWVKADRVLKAEAAINPRLLRVQISSIESASANLAKSQYGIFFLRRTGAAAYAPTDSTYPVLPAVALGSGSASSDPLTRVADEFVRVLRSPGATNDPVQSAHAAAAEALQSIPYSAAGAALRAAVAAEVPGRIWALAALFGMEDSEQLDTARIRYLESLKHVLLNPTAEARRAVSFLAYAMRGRLASSNAAGVLAALLQSNEPVVRRTAASALADLKSPQAIRPLARLALNDTDPEVRSYAMIGLGDITGEGPSAVGDEVDNLRYWRQWAAMHFN
jgi:hypothetical protein